MCYFLISLSQSGPEFKMKLSSWLLGKPKSGNIKSIVYGKYDIISVFDQGLMENSINFF